MNDEKRRRFGRLIAEGSAILASVLLAFAIQAWWEGRREYNDDRRLLRAVLDEMRSNLVGVELHSTFHRAVVAADTTALHLAGTDPQTLTVQYADSLIGDLSWWNGSSSWATSAVDALINAGRLSSIRDESLRRALGEWTTRVERVRATEDQEYDFFFNVFMPYFRREGALAQISDAIRARPGSTARFVMERVNYASRQTDHRRMLVSREFQNMVLQQRWIQDDILSGYGVFSKGLNDVIEALESELDAR